MDKNTLNYLLWMAELYDKGPAAFLIGCEEHRAKFFKNEVNTMSRQVRRFKRTGKALTVPLYRHNDDSTAFMLFSGALRFVELKTGKGSEKEKPAPCLRAVNLETGEDCDYIGNTLTLSAFEKQLKCKIQKLDNTKEHMVSELKDKAFEIIASKREGKRYKDIIIYPIDHTKEEIVDLPEPETDEGHEKTDQEIPF